MSAPPLCFLNHKKAFLVILNSFEIPSRCIEAYSNLLVEDDIWILFLAIMLDFFGNGS